MRTTNNNRKSKFLAFLLSVMMVSSAGAIFASCTDATDSDSSSSSTTEETEETKKDSGEIKNANFDFTTLSDTTVIGTSVTGWSRSVYSTASGSANSSKSASGVIDTSADKWGYLTESKYTEDELKAMDDATAEANWKEFKVKDKLAYYEIWKARDANKDKTISKEFAAYESINVDEEDIPTINPGKAPGSEDDKVLMIHNNYYAKTDKFVGTAQKYTSSSTVIVPAGESKKVSVWVKTADLQSAASDGTVQDAVGKGAYINVTHSVGGKSLDAYEIKNISTEGTSKDTNDWVQYTFYLKGSYYAETTFSLVLGLGQGSTNDRLEYVNGYAFFDNIIVEDVEDFATATKDITTITDLKSEKLDKTVDAFTNSAKEFAMDFYGDVASAWIDEKFTDNTINFSETAEDKNFDGNPEAATTDVKKVFANKAAIEADAANNEYLGYVYNNFFKDTTFVDNNEVLMFLSTNGTAYTAEKMTFTLKKGQDYMGISFYVKTSDMNGGVGAGVTLVDGNNKTAFTSIDTSDLAESEDNKTDGWQQVFFFIERSEDATIEDIEFSLTFNYGPTEITSSTTKTSFAQGFAAFTQVKQYRAGMTELEYEAAATGTYTKKVTLLGDYEKEAEGNSGFDTAVGVPSNALEEGLANPQNYKGVYNDNYRVKAPTQESDFNVASKREYNNYAGDAGLLNQEYFKEYFSTNNEAWLNTLKTMAATGLNKDVAALTADEVWAYHFGESTETATQPLLIMNDKSGTKPYGFIGNAKSTSEEYTAISLRVKAVNATAYVYLIDMDDETRQSTLSVSGKLTYWYDEDGNLRTGDPSKGSSAVAFKLQKNGLYKANQNWEGYEKLGDVKDEYFANLSAYTEKDGILYAAEDSATYDYYDYTWNREAFYKAEDGQFYTGKNGTGVKVIDLESITKTNGHEGVLEPRTHAQAAQNLMVEVKDTKGEWAYVTFYIRTGESAKNYRLEIWNGDRFGSLGIVEDGYVAFDMNNPGTASDNFALYESYEDIEGITKFESVFSYFDTDKHVRYDANLDEKKVGNPYEDYSSTDYTESIAFLAYLNNNDDNCYNIFADYSLSDQVVAAKVESDDTTEEDSTEEETESELNVWLLASSIAVAAVLVLAVASIIVRKIVEKYKKKHGARARKTVKEKKTPAAKKVEKKVDEDSPYND